MPGVLFFFEGRRKTSPMNSIYPVQRYIFPRLANEVYSMPVAALLNADTVNGGVLGIGDAEMLVENTPVVPIHYCG